MIILPLLLALQATGPAIGDADRFDRCADLAARDPAAAHAEAGRWRAAGGERIARACAGLAYARQDRWPGAAAEFEAAARAAEAARDPRADRFWAQAGNAWLAAGERGKAKAAIDAALATGRLDGFARGEALLDRARAMAADAPAAARGDLDQALILVPADPLAWLLSATLARRQGEVPRAQKDIAEALRRSPDDASVQLEAGNVAALARDEAGARAAWAEAARLGGDRPAGVQARAALAQFGAP